MGSYMDWRDKQLVSPDKPITNDQLASPEDGNPFEDDWKETVWAGYKATISRGDGLVEASYQSILLFLGLSPDELTKWRDNLIAKLSTKIRAKFMASAKALHDHAARVAQHKADNTARKRNAKNVQTIDPLAGIGENGVKAGKQAKPKQKPAGNSKGAMRKYSNEEAKRNMDKMF